MNACGSGTLGGGMEVAELTWKLCENCGCRSPASESGDNLTVPALATATKAAAAARRRRRATEEDDEAAIATDDGRGMNDAERRQRRSFIDGHEAMGTATLAETFGKHAGATDPPRKVSPRNSYC